MNKLLIIFIIALVFRFWNLTSFPVHFSMDEVAVGVAAREILNKGVDEWGQHLPLAFESVGDYKPPVNVYLTAISYAIFGMSEFATRFPVALIGSLTALVLALIARELKLTYWWFAGIFIAIVPWHVHFSRATFGAIIGLFFASVGLLYFIKWINSKSAHRNLYISLSALSLSVWAYHSYRVFIPILSLALIYIYKRDIVQKNAKQYVFKAICILAFFAIPFIFLTITTPAISERAAATSFMRDAAFTNNLHKGNYTGVVEYIFDNDMYLIFREWSGKYINYFDPRFLFWKGMQFTPPNFPGIGVMYAASFPIMLLGFSRMLTQKKQTRQLLLALLFLGPLPATFSINEQHPLRSLSWILFFALLAPIGFAYLKKLNKKYHILIAAWMILLVFNIAYFKNIYTIQFPNVYSAPWQYGYEQVSRYACQNKDNYDQVFISESFGADEYFTSLPQYYLAFYCGTHPFDHTNLQNKNTNIFIKRPLWEVDKDNYKNALFIAAPWDFPEDFDTSKIIKKLYFLDGKESFWFVETK